MGAGTKIRPFLKQKNFYFLRKKKSRIIHHKRAKSQQRRQKEKRRKRTAVQWKKIRSVKKVFVYVCGEVQASGVYELEQDSRVFEAIAKAGGLTENAAAEAVNQARVVVDGEQIYVPSLDEVKGAGGCIGSDRTYGRWEDKY
ncbi:MAG: SLBB domain-containing protein [[Ruminococcus] torques]